RKSFLCPALSQLLSTPVQRRLTLRPRLEAGLRPKILSRAFENFPLHELIDPQRILILVPRREVVKRRVNHQFVTFPVIKASLGKRNDLGASRLGKFAGRRDGGSRYTEARDKETHSGAEITVRCVPHHASLTQAADHESHVIPWDGNPRTVGFAPRLLQIVVYRIFVGAIHTIVVRMLPEHRTAQDRKSTRLNSSHVKISY